MTEWRKSSFSESGESSCVEVAFRVTGAAVRDSKNTAGPTLDLSERTWRCFVRAVGGRP
jgi:hypothetical protein